MSKSGENLIVVYVLKNCPKCKVLLHYLNLMKVPYETRDAQSYAVYLKNHGFTSVPVLEIDGQLYDFLSINELMLILQEQGYHTEET